MCVSRAAAIELFNFERAMILLPLLLPRAVRAQWNGTRRCWSSMFLKPQPERLTCFRRSGWALRGCWANAKGAPARQVVDWLPEQSPEFRNAIRFVAIDPAAVYAAVTSLVCCVATD
jgi:hypothetical protein